MSTIGASRRAAAHGHAVGAGTGQNDCPRSYKIYSFKRFTDKRWQLFLLQIHATAAPSPLWAYCGTKPLVLMMLRQASV
jgi:hypothetical protein